MHKLLFSYLLHHSKVRAWIIFFLTIVMSLIFHEANSQQDLEIGLPYVQNYTSNDYGAFDQNWGAVQDSLGIMYFANGDGVLCYNGTNWNLIQLPNKSTVFSLGISKNGIIWVGAIGELGYLETDGVGQLTYISLLSKLGETFHDFSEIRVICPTKNGVYFVSKKYIFRWDGESFEILENSGDTSMFYVNDILFKRIKGKGLMELKKNIFKPLPLGEIFADNKIYSLLPYRQNEFLIATRNQLYRYDGETVSKLGISGTSFFQDNVIYNGVLLNDGSYAFGSLQKGILILDTKGNQKIVLSQKGLLNSNQILGLYQDKSGILWAALQSGIAKIEYPSSFSYFNSHNNAPDMVFDFERFNEKLYVGSPEGLFYLKSESGTNEFVQINKDFGMVWDLLLFQDKLLVGCNSSIYEINTQGNSRKLFDLTVSSLYRSKMNPNRIFVATNKGLSSIFYDTDHWVLNHPFERVDFFVDKIIEMPTGNLWLSTDKNELVGISFANPMEARDLKNPNVRIFKPQDGLPDDVGKPYLIQDEFYFASDDKVFKYDLKSKQFFNDKELFLKFGLQNQKAKINYNDNGNVGLLVFEGENRIDQVLAVPNVDGTYVLSSLKEQRIVGSKRNGVFHETKDSILWYKGKPGIIRYDLKKIKPQHKTNSKALISNVHWKKDSLLFGGYQTSTAHQLPFKNNQLRFQYANPSFYDESKNQFQYILEGFDEDWSSWSSETKKDYTNIPGGKYNFKVRSKNIFNQISNEDSYSFSILPPWYRTWWAYSIYFLGAIGMVVLYSKWRSQELQKQNAILENTVNKRTMEIQQKNELLNHQTEQLVQLNDSKTHLYSNIAHEFRTPLTVILGMANTLKTNVKEKTFEGAEKSLEMIRRNGKNLLHLVNEMLDLAKVESGSMERNMVQTDVVPFVKYLSESFHSLAETKEINLTVYSEIDALEMDIDVNKMASIISNLLSNAIKFTAANGKVIVHLNKVVTQENIVFSVKVQDNGLGLSEDDISHLFDRFYQADNQSSQYQEGTGIGLSLAKEFTELLNGTISVESTLGKGSTFIVQLPVTNTAVKTAEAELTVEPPIKKTATRLKKEPKVLNETSALQTALIIEDNEDVAHYLKSCLKGKYQTIHAKNGIKGIEMAYEEIPDIIISDVMMPGKDGFEVCALLKSDVRTDHIPIILLTAKVTTDDRLTGLSHGADAYLAKPFNEKELVIRLNQLILVRKKLVEKIQKDGLNALLEKQPVSPETKFLQKVIQFVHKNIENSAFGSKDLAEKLHLSESQIYKKLKAITNKSTAIFIRSIRLQKAKESIETTNKTISEIAYENGFNDPSWFSRAFKEEFGFAPSEIHR